MSQCENRKRKCFEKNHEICEKSQEMYHKETLARGLRYYYEYHHRRHTLFMYMSEDRQPYSRFEVISRGDEAAFLDAILPPLTTSRFDMASQISHGLRTPLTSILGFAEVLCADSRLSSEQRREFAGHMQDELRKLVRFVDVLSDYVDLQSPPCELSLSEADLTETVRSAAAEFSEDVDRLSIVLEVSGAPHIVLADHKRIGSAVQYLITNSFAATPKGGRITLRVESDRGQSLIRVADTGRGIPETELENIFQPFYRITRPTDCGSELGLGLAVARMFVRMHGGNIEVSSCVGTGTEMRIELPRGE